ncbi:MAG: autotransporter domain-containing protein [Akkermansia sp.]|nr:autotransporter domain-containing protein [Akkermansia sp.]
MKKTLFITMLAAALLGSGVANAAETLYASDYTGGTIALGSTEDYDKLVVDTPLTLTTMFGCLDLYDGATLEFLADSSGAICCVYTSAEQEDETVYFNGVDSIFDIKFNAGAQAIVAASAGTSITLIQDPNEDSEGFCFWETEPSDTTLTLNGKGYNETVELDGVSFTYVGPKESDYTFKAGEIGFTGYEYGSHALNLVVGDGSVPEPTTTTASPIGYGTYAGAYSKTDAVSGGDVTIQADGDHGDDHSSDEIVGGFTEGVQMDATYNTITMTGGQVFMVGGGSSIYGNAENNTVSVSDGQVGTVVGGNCMMDGSAIGNAVTVSGGQVGDVVYGGNCSGGTAEGNTVTISGGQVGSVCGGNSISGNANGNTVVLSGGEVTGNLIAGNGRTGASDNLVYLVGKGASVEIGGQAYTGCDQGVTVGGRVAAGQVRDGAGSGNSIEIYGTAITAATLCDTQMVNFHIADGVLLSQEGMVSLTSTSVGKGLDLTGVELGFSAADVQDWAAYEDQSITLVTAAQSITIDAGSLGDVEIKDADGTTVATATLALGGSDDVLSLTDIKPYSGSEGPDALDVTLVNSLWASSAYVGEFVRLSEAQGYALKAGDTAMWGGGFGSFMHVTGDKGFKSNGGGYGIGVNHAFSDNTQGGLSFGQGFGSYHNSGADGATVHQRAILAAATASTRIGKDFSLGGHLAYGSVRNRADCRLEGDSERARWNDNVFNLGARAAYDFHATDATAITPFLGLDWMYGAQESINGAYARHYSHGRLNELRLPVGVTVSTSAEVGSTKLLPQLSVAYVPAIAQQNPHANVATDGADYRVKGYAPGRNAFMLNVGMNAVFSDTWSAGASYTLETRRHAVDQSVNASVRYTF